MAERVFLHVGTPKSGTTFLQTVLWQNRERLARDGLLVPGDRLYDHNLAAQGLRTRKGAKRPRPIAMWQRFVDEARDWSGDVIVTNEWLTLANPQQVTRATSALAPAEVHVVVTTRDFTALVPAAWQESLKVGNPASLADFLTALDTDGDRWTWASLDPAEVVATWTGDVPADRVHVVTVPPRGAEPDLLWRRLAAVLGRDPAAYDTASSRANESLGAEAAALLQRVGPGLRAAVAPEGTHWVEPYRWLRNYVSHELLVPRGGSRIALRPAEWDALRARATRSRERLAEAGLDVAGDLADLTAAEPAAGGVHPDDVTAEQMLEVAGPLLADLLARVRAETERRGGD